MNIGEAVAALWRGEHVTRQGWNGKSLRLGLQRPSLQSKVTEPYVYLEYPDGLIVPWTCSQADLLANDWILV